MAHGDTYGDVHGRRPPTAPVVREIRLTSPRTRGDDVVLIQWGLGLACTGVYDSRTAAAVRTQLGGAYGVFHPTMWVALVKLITTRCEAAAVYLEALAEGVGS